MMTRAMKTTRTIAVVVALCGSGGFVFGAAPGGEAICDQPWIFYCDNFENHPVGPANFWPAQLKSPYWDLGPTQGHSLSDSQGADGTKALQQTYPAGYDYGAGFGYQMLENGTADFWIRLYVKYSSNFKQSPIGIKPTVRIMTGPWSDAGRATLDFMHHMWGSWKPIFQIERTFGGSTANYNQNVGDVTLAPGQWYCMEGHFAQGSNGSGTIDGWINGTHVISYANVPMHNGNPGPAHELQWTGHWNCDGESAAPCPQLPQNYKPEEQYRWIDAMVMGTQRVGCLGSLPPPPSDTQAPSLPSGLDAQAASSSQINLSWNASTDNVGVTGYRIFRGVTQIATTAGTSYSNTGLSALTAYTYTVAAYDAAGNVSAQSAAASATTPAAPPPGPSGLLVDFGSSAAANVFGLAGWNTVIKDVYTTYSSAGPGGTMSGFNGGYDYQGVTGTARSFAAGDEIVVTWYNGGAAAATFTPQLSMTVAGRVGTGAGWQPMSSATIPAAGTATTRFMFSAATAGSYSLVNVNVNLDNGAMVCDKIALVSAAAPADALPPAKPKNMRVQ